MLLFLFPLLGCLGWRSHAGLEYHYQRSLRWRHCTPSSLLSLVSRILQGSQAITEAPPRLSIEMEGWHLPHVFSTLCLVGLAKDRRRTNSEEHHQMMLKPIWEHSTSSCWRVSLAAFFFFFFPLFSFFSSRKLATQLSDDRCASRCFDVHHGALPLIKGLLKTAGGTCRNCLADYKYTIKEHYKYWALMHCFH